MNLRQSVSNHIIESLSDSEDALARDLAAHRKMLQIALTLLHEVTCELGRLRDAHRRLRDEFRLLHQADNRDELRAHAPASHAQGQGHYKQLTRTKTPTQPKYKHKHQC